MADMVVLSARVRLLRNYDDLPFSLTHAPESAELITQRSLSALSRAGLLDSLTLHRLVEHSDTSLRALRVRKTIPQAAVDNCDIAAVAIEQPNTACHATSITFCGEDHVRIQAIRPGLSLQKAAERCFQLDDALSAYADAGVRFAFDEQLGYLTACPTGTGTGMRASILLHLPLLTHAKQMGNVGQLVSRVGFNIRGVYGEGSEALGSVYQVSNQVTLGRTEQELLSTLTQLGEQLRQMETEQRQKALQTDALPLEDAALRAYAILTHARLLTLKELYRLWSDLYLGIGLGFLHLNPTPCAELLVTAQDDSVRADIGQGLTDIELDAARADLVREQLHLAAQ